MAGLVRVEVDDVEPQCSFLATKKDKWPKLLELKEHAVRESLDDDVRQLAMVSLDVLKSGAWKVKYKTFREFIEVGCTLSFGLYQTIMNAMPHIGHESKIKKDLAVDVGRKIDANDAREAPLNEHGEIGWGRGRVDNVKSTKGGNDPAYLLARLARDSPDILDALERGEYKSVRAAAIAAGIVKVPTAEEKTLKAFSKCENRLDVLRQIVTQLDDCEWAFCVEIREQ